MKIKRLLVGPLSSNCYLVFSEKELLIIDPGAEAEKILGEVGKIGIQPKYIIATHYHHDHVSALEEIRRKTGAKSLIHQQEKDFINFEIDRFLQGGDKIGVGDNILEIIHTPGHTQWGICLIGEESAFVGDTLFENGFGRTDFPGGSMKDLEKSLKRLSELLKPGITVYPGHGEPFNINNK